MKKVAVCIPTYNEADVIEETVKKVDNALKLFGDYKCCIVNSDTASTDGTSSVFEQIETVHKKVSIKSKLKGKGVALISFFHFCLKEKVDYAVTLDADVVSMDETWIIQFLEKLIYENADFVTPIYVRSRFEGSTTNQFALPIVYALTGKYIRQPIGGDFAFSKSYVKFIAKQNFDENTRGYGIDIFMTLMAALGDFNLSNVSLGEKIHKPSFGKMHYMFREVCGSCTKVISENLDILHRLAREGYEEECSTNTSVTIDKCFAHKEKANELLVQCIDEIKKLNYAEAFGTEMQKDIGQGFISQVVWVDAMVTYINKILENEITYEFQNIFSYVFVIRAISYWNEVQNWSEIEAESILVTQAREIRKKYLWNWN